MQKSDQIDLHISVAERYRSASAELNQRLNARQVSYLAHAAAVAAVINFMLGNQVKESSTLVILFPSALSLAFACWIRSQDLTVGLLSAFCRNLEELDRNDSSIPSWHSKAQGWQTIAMKHREWMELAFFLVNGALVETPVFFLHQRYLALDRKTTLVLLISHFIFGWSCWMILSIRTTRGRMYHLALKESEAGIFVLNEDLKATPKPVDLTAVVAFFAVILFSSHFALTHYLPQRFDELYIYNSEIWVGLVLVVAIRCWILRVDLISRRRRKAIRKLPRWILRFNLALLIAIVGVASLDRFSEFEMSYISHDIGAYLLHFALFSTSILLGYLLPDALLSWNRHEPPGWQKNIRRRRKVQSEDILGVTTEPAQT